MGRLATTVYPDGTVESQDYDEEGRLVATVLPDGSRETRAYNADGTLAGHTDLGGATRTFQYDAAQRLTRRAYPDGSEVTFTYTPDGQRASVTAAHGTTSYSYDSRGRLQSKTDPNGYSLSYAYDPQGNRTRLTATVGAEVYTTAYGYDPLNRLETVTDSRGGVTSLAYDQNGNRARIALPNSVTTDYTYNALNRLTNLSSTNSVGDVLQSYAYTLGAAGNRTRIDEHDGTSRNYAYDDLHRLTQDRVTDASSVQVYRRDFVYDAVGNRTTQTLDEGSGPTVVASTYDDRDRLLTAAATSYGWDTNGNLTSQDGTSYGWDFENRLTSATLPDGTVIETTYDADGNRVRTSVTTPGGGTATVVDYLIDTTGFLSHVVADVVGGQVQTLYTRADDQLIGLYRPVSDASRYYHADGLGSVRVLSDEAGAGTDRYNYTAFGELLTHTGSDLQPYRFAGEPFDPDTGFSYNRARWLDVVSGRFVATDAVTGRQIEPVTLHKYLYANLEPVRRLDPTGLFTLTLEIGIIQVLGVLALPGAVPSQAKERKRRPMTSGERQLADTVFRGAIDYGKVTIIKGRHRGFFLPVRNRMFTPNNRIYYHPRSDVPRRMYSDDFSMEIFGAKHDFIHELTHVWQHQQGQRLLVTGILARVARGATYPYLPVDPSKSWDDYNIEQQGTIVEDYFWLLHRPPRPRMPNRSWFESILPWLQTTTPGQR